MAMEIGMEADSTKEGKAIQVLKGLRVRNSEVHAVMVRNYSMQFAVNVARIARFHFVPVVRNQSIAELVSEVLRRKFRQIGKISEIGELPILLNRGSGIKA